MKVARLNEAFPQDELKGLNRRSVRQLTELLRHQSSLKLGVNGTLNIWHLNGLLRRPNRPRLGFFSRRLTRRLKKIQKPLMHFNLADALLLEGHNSDV
ncbi:hypothetical protein TNCV_1000251 [Trichonephila clavipes]|nr:hypothetical protein TNCV_1000251 [Trichonephila clavipes]